MYDSLAWGLEEDHLETLRERIFKVCKDTMQEFLGNVQQMSLFPETETRKPKILKLTY